MMKMKNKLISLNFQLSLVVEENGQERTVQFSGILPSHKFQKPSQVVNAIREFLAAQLGARPVAVQEPERIKAQSGNTDRLVQELGY